MISLIISALSPKLGQRVATIIAWGGVLLLAALALYAAYSWAYNRGEADERTKWEAAAEHLEDADASADAEAIDVAHDMKGQVDATNQRAADAARDSDDPLGAAFGELRGEGARKGDKATR